MSDQGWREFLAAADVADWVVLHSGAMAVFRVRSLAERSSSPMRWRASLGWMGRGR